MSFAEEFEDIGGDYADYDLWLELQCEITEIQEDRKRRIRNLSGKYIVATIGKSSGKTVFYQDRKNSKGGYWTQYLSNALGFTTLADAKLHASGFKFGNPKVAFVTSEGIYQWVK